MSQNTFVKTFTKEETEAVDKLKALLPDVLKTAFQSEEPYVLWGVALDKESQDERLNVLLVKFLRARDLNVDTSAKMLTDTLVWRKEFKTDNILDESFDDTIFGKVGYMYQTDKEGRPVCYNFYGDLDQDKVFGDINIFIRWRVQLMEQGVKLVDLVQVDSMVQVHDYKGASMFGRTANAKAATKEIIKIMQDNYPEYLATKYFVNVPWWGSKIFKLIRPLLPEATFKKFVVCSNDELLETLTQSIEQVNLPEVYQPPKAKAVESVQVVEEKSVEPKKDTDVNPKEVKQNEELNNNEESENKEEQEEISPAPVTEEFIEVIEEIEESKPEVVEVQKDKTVAPEDEIIEITAVEDEEVKGSKKAEKKPANDVAATGAEQQ
ncbi:Non-classical phosphatidylinositol transfer protein (PITP) [Apophysomyces sp. BC1034]|nr:Non-classical phosphatidylinositol transfer protein (PITP) [Apophysomyces sp. BC1015]KAG0181120.1 Non-classical phosphatidylinositol transfer protein (PITP) [Apophysomyces sp. BC1021]KAG0191590.1 Non-classical phosphatidylinositol transfer protein (PITP) [Apophysomyces sp. BC1034]